MKIKRIEVIEALRIGRHHHAVAVKASVKDARQTYIEFLTKALNDAVENPDWSPDSVQSDSADSSKLLDAICEKIDIPMASMHGLVMTTICDHDEDFSSALATLELIAEPTPKVCDAHYESLMALLNLPAVVKARIAAEAGCSGAESCEVDDSEKAYSEKARPDKVGQDEEAPNRSDFGCCPG